MSEKERLALETITNALETMSDYQKGRLVGFAECLEQERDKARAEMPAADDASEKE